MDGNGNFRAGNADGYGIRWDTQALIVSSSEFYLGDATNYISGSGGKIDIASDDFTLDATTMYLDSATNSGMIGLGTDGSAVTYGATGVYLDGTGKFSAATANGYGIFWDTSTLRVSSSEFYFGDSSNFISGSGGDLKLYSTGETTLSGSSINLSTPNMFLGATGSAYVSASGGKMEISSSGFFVDADLSLIHI